MGINKSGQLAAAIEKLKQNFLRGQPLAVARVWFLVECLEDMFQPEQAKKELFDEMQLDVKQFDNFCDAMLMVMISNPSKPGSSKASQKSRMLRYWNRSIK